MNVALSTYEYKNRQDIEANNWRIEANGLRKRRNKRAGPSESWIHSEQWAVAKRLGELSGTLVKLDEEQFSSAVGTGRYAETGWTGDCSVEEEEDHAEFIKLSVDS